MALAAVVNEHVNRKISATRELSPKLKKKNVKKFFALLENGQNGPNATPNLASTVRNSASAVAPAHQAVTNSTPTAAAEIWQSA